MLILKYRKTDEARFVSHMDLLRQTERALRRANIPVKFSQGFNPHPLLYFSAPTALGVASAAEYLTLDCDLSLDGCLSRYNASVPGGLQAEKCFYAMKNPNLQAVAVAADYVFPTAYEGIIIGDTFEIRYMKKGVETVEDARARILGVFNADGKLCLRLASGNVTLRPDRTAASLSETFGRDIGLPSILKTAQYVCVDGEYINVDDYLTGLE